MKKTGFLLFFLLTLLSVQSQEPSNFQFRKYQVNDGLSENSVTCIMQDRKGFLWLGTRDGLNKFNGSGFQVYRNQGKPTSIGNNFIKSIVEGPTNEIYIGTDNGIYIMDLITEKFTRIEKLLNYADEIITSVTSMLIDRNGLLWITAMNGGVYTFDPIKVELTRMKLQNFDLTNTITWKVFEDKSGSIWVGTRIGLLQYNLSTGMLEPVEGITEYSNNSSKEILTIFEDAKGNIWLGTWSDGIILYNKQQKKPVYYYGDPKSKDYITHIRCFLQYDDSKILVGADDGLYLFDTGYKTCKRIDVPYSPYSLGDQNVYCMYKDHEKGIWIGTYFGGLNYLSTYTLNIENYVPGDKENALSGKAISQFCEDEKGNLWIATEDGGLNYFDTKTKKNSQPIATSYHNIHPIMINNDELWIGTFSRGIDIYNLKTKKMRNYQNIVSRLNSIDDDCIFSLYTAKSGDIYVGTAAGLNKYNPQNDDFTRIETDSISFVYDIKEDSHQNLWVASYKLGAIKYDSKRNKWIYYNTRLNEKNPMVNAKLTGIYIDNHKRLWFSSEGQGIFLYDYEKDDFINISEQDGLPNNVVYGILEDQFGDIWVSSNKGLATFNPNNTKEWRYYDQNDGLQSNEFNYKSSYKASDGKLYFGGINGFNCFYPQKLSENINTVVPFVEITGVHLLGDNDSIQQSYILECLNAGEAIKLHHNKSSFTISYVSLSYISQSKNQYAYKLEGIDKDWNMVGNNRSVTYVNLPPGKYTFKIKASNNHNIWNQNGDELKFEILPPFWWSTPSKVLYTLISMVILSMVALYYKKQYKKKQQQQLDAYKSEQESLIFKSKIDFFTNIAHEIRTPVSLIKAPLEEIILSGDGNTNTKQNLSIIEKNSDRLSVLINQLLDFRKMDSTHAINISEFNIKKLLIEIYERFKKTAQSKQIDFELRLPQNDEIIVQSDMDALIKITANFLTNALKHTKDKIILELSLLSEKKICISVTDNGKGIPSEYKEQVFDPFYQIQTSENKKGTGIGLFLVKHLSDVLKGKIEVNDNPVGGTIFSFTFENASLQSVYTEHKQADVASDARALQLYTSGEKKTILIVEDNPDMLNFIDTSLRHTYHTDMAHNAVTAIDLIDTKSYDLIISDIMMPDIDGLEFVKRLRTNVNYSHIPVILLSAKTDNATKIEGLEAGADVFIEKPFSISYLRAQISSLLNNRTAILEAFNQSPLVSYSVLTTNKSDQLFIEKLNDEIDMHLSDSSFTIESLSDKLLISRSNLQRKLKIICDVTPGDYLRTYRLKKAATLMLEDGLRINEVAFEVGFSSSSYFSKCFAKQFGMLPKEFIRKHTNPDF